MKIVYINRGKIKAKSSTDESLERAYSRDIRLSYNRHKKDLAALGISEIDFVAKVQQRLHERKGIYCQ